MFNPRVLMLVIGACSALGVAVVTNYINFEQTAFAADNCDTSSNCTNTQTGIDNIQDDCTNFSSCRNLVNGERCRDVGFACINFAEGNVNRQKNNCLFVSTDCNNSAQGDSNKQNLVCVRSTQCSNEINFPTDGFPTDGNRQKSVCVNSGTCQNEGTDTKVISVKSSTCKNDDASE